MKALTIRARMSKSAKRLRSCLKRDDIRGIEAVHLEDEKNQLYPCVGSLADLFSQRPLRRNDSTNHTPYWFMRDSIILSNVSQRFLSVVSSESCQEFLTTS
jgi:hypothetical protein